MLWQNDAKSSFGIDLASSTECGPGCIAFHPRWEMFQHGIRPISPKFAEIRRNSPKFAETVQALARNSTEIRPKFAEIWRDSPKFAGIRRNGQDGLHHSPKFARNSIEIRRNVFQFDRNSTEIRRNVFQFDRNSPKFAEIRRIVSMSAGAGMGFRRNSTEFAETRRNSKAWAEVRRNSTEIRPNCF